MILVENTSPSRQTRVTHFMLPQRVADKIPARGVVKPLGWVFEQGDAVGDFRRIWLRAELAGNEVVKINPNQFAEMDSILWAVPDGVRLDWLLDEPKSGMLMLNVNAESVPFKFDGVVEGGGALASVWRMRARIRGWDAVAYVTLAAGQDVIDVQGRVKWNDPQSLAMETNDSVRLTFGDGLVCHQADLLGYSTYRNDTILLAHDNAYPDGFATPFWITLTPKPAVVTADLEFRLAAQAAAAGGPILALAGTDEWTNAVGPLDAHWKQAPTPEKTTPPFTQFDQWFDRPWANPGQTGQTGDQGIWGRIKNLHLFNGARPTELTKLRVAASDYFCRAHHFNDLPAAPDAARRTYNGAPFWRIARHAWGKGDNGDPAWGWGRDRAYLDDQHRGNIMPAVCAMLTGDWIMRDELDDLLAVEVRHTRHGFSGDLTLEAPRASGRLLHEWAWWHTVANAEQRAILKRLASITVGIIERQPGMRATGPVHWLESISRFDNKNPLRNTVDANLGYEAAAPWQQSFVVDGLLDWVGIWRKSGDFPSSAHAWSLAIVLAQTVVAEGLWSDPHFGWVMATYVKVNADGAANPDAYRTAPRGGAKTDLSGNCDLVYAPTGAGLFSLYWYSGAILLCAMLGDSKAQAARQWLIGNARTLEDREWLIGDPSGAAL